MNHACPYKVLDKQRTKIGVQDVLECHPLVIIMKYLQSKKLSGEPQSPCINNRTSKC